MQAIRKLRELPGLAGAIKTALVQVWREDPQLLVNILLIPTRLTSLRLAVGPLWSPELLAELVESPRWMGSAEQIWFRFNPYVTQRSYYTFLKGTYFDTVPLLLASNWTASTAPRLKRLAFCQDHLPNHGVERKETPAFGLHELGDGLEDSESSATASGASTPAGSEARFSRRGDDKMSFAQPIVFHRLFCLTTLSLSPLGTRLESLVLRLPRRNVLVALVAFPVSPNPFSPQPSPFRSLRHLDLSTTTVGAGDMRLPLLLRLMPDLEHLVLDRCSGLIGSREAAEPTAMATMRWLGKVLGGVPSSRAEEAIRAWRKISKERPTFAPAPGPDHQPTSNGHEKKRRPGRSGYASAPRPARVSTEAPSAPPATWAQQQKQAPLLLIRDIQIFPPLPRLLSLSMGLFPLSPDLASSWQDEFAAGLEDSLDKTIVKMEEYLHRYDVWEREGKLEIPVSASEGGAGGRQWGRRMLGFHSTVERVQLEAGLSGMEGCAARGGEQEDEAFTRFLDSRGLVVITPSTGHLILSFFRSLLASGLNSPLLPSFRLCLVPDCSSSPGIAHLSLAAGQTQAVKEPLEQREERENVFASQEAAERLEWRRPSEEHISGCGHLFGRLQWGEE